MRLIQIKSFVCKVVKIILPNPFVCLIAKNSLIKINVSVVIILYKISVFVRDNKLGIGKVFVLV